MAGERGAIRAVGFEPRRRKEPALGQDRINGRGAVTLADDEAIAVGPVGVGRVNAQHFGVEDRQQIGHRERGADVRCIGAVDHPQGLGPDPAREGDGIELGRLL